jgi:hypothetical protein
VASEGAIGVWFVDDGLEEGVVGEEGRRGKCSRFVGTVAEEVHVFLPEVAGDL